MWAIPVKGATTSTAKKTKPVRGYSLEKIWDPWIRLWHWVLAAVVSLGWYWGEFMSFTSVKWHFYCGYLVLGLIALRLLWGIWGPKQVRLRALIPSPSAFRAYLGDIGERSPSGIAGHNPLGSLSVIVLLLLLTAQATSGLFLEAEDYFETAPLYSVVSESTVATLTWWHKLLSKCILVMTLLHVLAIFYYWIWKRENLIRPMITGWKWVRNPPDKSG